MTGLLSVLPPLSPRAIQARNAFSRSSRRAENWRNGSTLERLERHRVLALQPALLGGAARGGAGEIRQAGEIALGKRHHVGLLVGEHVLPERRAEARQPLADLLQPLLRRRIEPGAGAAEQRVIALQHARLLGASGRDSAARL